MSLDWSVAKVENHETLCWVDDVVAGKKVVRVNPVTEALVFLTMGVGMYAITEKNAEEFAGRVMQFEDANGSMVSRWEGGEVEPRPITLDDVRAHVGLRTNASTKSRAVFDKEIRAAIARKVKRMAASH